MGVTNDKIMMPMYDIVSIHPSDDVYFAAYICSI
jgi:hypothetical protein